MFLPEIVKNILDTNTYIQCIDLCRANASTSFIITLINTDFQQPT